MLWRGGGLLRHPLQGTHVEKIHCLSSVQFSPVTQSCLTLLPHGLQHARPPVHLQLPEFTQTHVHRVIDAIQPSHPLQSPSPLFQPSIFSSIRIFSNESVLCIRWPMFQLQHQSFQWIFTTDFPAIQLKKESTTVFHLWRSPFRKPCVTCLLALFTFSVL